MKLYHFPISPNSRRVVATLAQLNFDCEFEVVNLQQGEQMKPEFLKLNPNHMIPTLIDDDFVLWESTAIMQYLCSKSPEGSKLWPSDPKEQADVSRWMAWGTTHWGKACSIYIFEYLVKAFLNLGAVDPVEISKGNEMFKRFAQVLDDHLKGKTWLACDRLTLADFLVGSYLDLAEMAKFPVAGYQEISRWYQGIEALDAWQKSAPPKN